MELESIILSEVSQLRKPKAIHFLSLVAYIPNRNARNMKNRLY
jgi:hypothetical protein